MPFFPFWSPLPPPPSTILPLISPLFERSSLDPRTNSSQRRGQILLLRAITLSLQIVVLQTSLSPRQIKLLNSMLGAGVSPKSSDPPLT